MMTRWPKTTAIYKNRELSIIPATNVPLPPCLLKIDGRRVAALPTKVWQKPAARLRSLMETLVGDHETSFMAVSEL